MTRNKNQPSPYQQLDLHVTAGKAFPNMLMNTKTNKDTTVVAGGNGDNNICLQSHCHNLNPAKQTEVARTINICCKQRHLVMPEDTYFKILLFGSKAISWNYAK